MRGLGILILVGFFPLSLKGQLLNPPTIKSLNPSAKFNPATLAENGITEIVAEEEFKPDGEKIRKTGRKKVYRFDKFGRIITESRITERGDTLITSFSYSDGRLECEVRNDAAGRFSYCYTYEDGRPSSIKYARLPRKGESETPVKISTEVFEYRTFDDQLHATLFNSAGRPYRKEIRYYDENGYLLKYLKTFVMTRSREEETYRYGEKGYVIEKRIEDGRTDLVYRYAYDEVGNLLSEEKWMEDKKVSRREYVYRDDMLIKAELERDEVLGAIRITSYAYRFGR